MQTAAKPRRTVPTRKALTTRQLGTSPKPIDVDHDIEDAAWIVAVHDDEKELGELIDDLEMWLGNLQAIADEHGTDLPLGRLGGREMESERKRLKRLFGKK